VAAFAGNTWEVFAVRVWFVAYLAWLLSLPGNHIALPALGLVSGLASLALAATAGGPIGIVLPLLILVQITSFADVGALAGGAVAAADPTQRGAALALYALAGFTTGFLGPVAVGNALDWFGGTASASGWRVGYSVIAVGSAAAAWAVWRVPE
jgi:hypothetical protein